MNEFEGKNIIITGATRGLGLELARYFSNKGSNLCLCAKRIEHIKKFEQTFARGSVPNKVIIRKADISDVKQIDNLYDYALSEFGNIDAVVNNAGVFGPIGKTEDIPWEGIQDCVNINLMGTMYSMRKAVKMFKRQGNGGKILNLSGGGATRGRPFFISYAITKTAIVRATETFAEEVKDYGIYINAMAPGTLDTEMSDYIVKKGQGVLDEGVVKQIIKEKKEGDKAMSKAINCASFLLSSKSDGITGRLISAVWDDIELISENKDLIYANGIYTLRRTTLHDAVV